MSSTPWFRRSRDLQARAADQLVREWIDHEVAPFSPFWRERLRGARIDGVAALSSLPAATEAEIAGAGGPGNPALVLSPSEDEFKANTSRRELLAAAREAGGHGATGRREAIWRRYKPVHVHEAGVDRLLSIAYTRADLDLLHLAGARLAEVLGWGSEDALVNLVPAGPSVRFWALYHAALATRMTALHPRGAGQAVMGPARRALALLPASVLTVPAEEAEATLDALADGGTQAVNLRQVLVVGPPPNGPTRVRLAGLAERIAARPVTIQAAWAPETSRVLYGESPPAANDPPEATYGLVTYPDLEVLSVRDPVADQPVADGEAGELVVTSAGWRGTALVRFATGSWVGGMEVGANHPVTGATVPRIAPRVVDGAWQPAIDTGGGTVRPDLRPAPRLVEPVVRRIGASDWSLRADRGELVLAVAAPPGSEPPLRELAAKLGRACGVDPVVRLDAAQAAVRPRVGEAG